MVRIPENATKGFGFALSAFLVLGAVAGISATSIQGYVLLSESASTQDVAGSPGADGEDGADGADGADGQPGARGPVGPMGPVGPIGPMGPPGEQGIQGPAGLPGVDGATGAQGLPGAQGPTGPQGATGPQGSPGPQGPAGQNGQDGTPGVTGAQGAQGIPGATGATGPMGPTGVVSALSPLIYDANTQTISIDLDAFSRLGSLDYLQFNPETAASNAPGRLVWNAELGTLNLQGIDGGVTLQIGQESVQRVINSTTSTLLNGRVVRVTGAQGRLMTVEYADNASPTQASSVIGVLTQDIAPGAAGYVTTYGLINELNTVGFTAGQPLYLDGNGTLTNVRPTNGRIFQLGYAVQIGATDGVIYVNPLQNFEPNIGGPCTVPGQSGSGVYAWHNLAGSRWIVVCDY